MYKESNQNFQSSNYVHSHVPDTIRNDPLPEEITRETASFGLFHDFHMFMSRVSWFSVLKRNSLIILKMHLKDKTNGV